MNTEKGPYQSSSRMPYFLPESTVASHQKKSYTTESTLANRVSPDTIKSSIIRGGKLASESPGDIGSDTHVHPRKSPFPAATMSGALQDDPGHDTHPKLHRIHRAPFESDRSFRHRMNHQKDFSSSPSTQQPPTPGSKTADVEGKATVTQSTDGRKYSSVIGNYVHLIVDKHVAWQQTRGNTDAYRSEIDAKKTKDERRRIKKLCFLASLSHQWLPDMAYGGSSSLHCV